MQFTWKRCTYEGSKVLTSWPDRVKKLVLLTPGGISRLTMPTLLLIGQEDALRDARKVAERMLKLVPELTVQIIPQAGHALYNTPGCIMPFLAAKDCRTQEKRIYE